MYLPSFKQRRNSLYQSINCQGNFAFRLHPFTPAALFRYISDKWLNELENILILTTIARQCESPIVNVKNSTRVVVGGIIGEILNLTDPLLYYGEGTERPIYQLPKIKAYKFMILNHYFLSGH